MNKEVTFFIHDVAHTVNTANITPQTTLNSYIRDVLNLKATKFTCLEGGCGACVVVVQRRNPVTQKDDFISVNSCLVSILSCHGWRIYTNEGIGNPLKGYHPIQQTLAKFNGTQCGYCSSGMVMNMYGLYQSSKLTMKEVENSFGGNICRCTGYRSILAAFKSLCKDADQELIGKYPDIEDVLTTCCKNYNVNECDKKKCEEKCHLSKEKSIIFSQLNDNSKWIKVYNLKDLLKVIEMYADLRYRLVFGNTAKGVYEDYKYPRYEVYVDINDVEELQEHEINEDQLILGANITLHNTMKIFHETSKNKSKFSYLKQLADHIDLIANPHVRHIGSLAGNLMMKHDHNEFPSDIFLILTTIGAKLVIVGIDGQEIDVGLESFLKYSMKRNVLKSIILPILDENTFYRSYKIMPRAQNVHAIINAGFLINFENNSYIVQSARIIYGNVSSTTIHATETENFLIGKALFENTTLQTVYSLLDKEINPVDQPPDPSPEMRKQLTISLFYKMILSIAPKKILSTRNISGGNLLKRPLSNGTQDYETKKLLYPLTQPIPKVEALAQTSGQAEYIVDMVDLPNQLYAAFVLSNAPPNSKIIKIDPSKALNMEGIIAYYDKNDIPGNNSFMPEKFIFYRVPEEIFCSGLIRYYYQPVGILVGKDSEFTEQATKFVDITYHIYTEKPLLNVRDVLKANRKDRIFEEQTIIPKKQGHDVKHVVKGNFDIGQQYHFHMENQCCNVIPTEDGLNVYPSTQAVDAVQLAISQSLNIPNNKVTVVVRRCGGAFGGKITRNSLLACGTALAAWKLRKPVKMIMSLKTNMMVIGKRWPLSGDYEVGVNNSGKIQYLNAKLYSDMGAFRNENPIQPMLDLFTCNYNNETFHIEANTVITDIHTNTSARGPGSTEGLAMIETIMEHVAYETNIDPVKFRKINITKELDLLKYLMELNEWADVDERKQEILEFNKRNRWMKKGLAVVPMAFTFEINGPYTVTVSIYHGDGSVAISHGGIEMGQGINTKAVQVCAYKLGIPLDKVICKPSNNISSPNNLFSAFSITSEAICYGVIQACDQLIQRIKPYKDKMKNPKWEDLVQKCFTEFVNLTAIGMYSAKEPNVKPYIIYGACATEVVIDILTGQHLIQRMDILEDVGRTLSPEVDIGQVEGAVVMGIGYHTIEQVVYNTDGKILTNNTWTYYPPGAKDIPIDFRIKFPKDNINPVGVLKSKAMAEPPLCMTISVPLAIRNAVSSARMESDSSKSKWYPVDGPSTVENTFINSLNNYKQYIL